MLENDPVRVPDAPSGSAPLRIHARKRVRVFWLFVAIVALAFAVPLWRLVYFAAFDDLHSYVLLIPIVSLFLVFLSRRMPVVSGNPPVLPAIFPATLACLALLGYFAARHFGFSLQTSLSLSTLSFLCFLLTGAVGILGWPALSAYRFALSFLVFFIPLPLEVTDFLSWVLQFASAEAVDFAFSLTGIPFIREGLAFRLPGLTIYVGQECSGIRSTLILFISGVLAAHLFLRTGWKKAVFLALIFPLGILRNAFRITLISWITVNIDRGVIDGWLHHQGGAMFFIISLIPLFAVLLWLRRTDLEPIKGEFTKKAEAPVK